MDSNLTGPASIATASMRGLSALPMPFSAVPSVQATGVALAARPRNHEAPSLVGVGSYRVQGHTCAIAPVSQLDMGEVCVLDITDRKFSTRLGPRPDSPPV